MLAQWSGKSLKTITVEMGHIADTGRTIVTWHRGARIGLILTGLSRKSLNHFIL